MAQSAPVHDERPIGNCGHKACGRDLRTVNPTYGISAVDARRFCSRKCRHDETGVIFAGDQSSFDGAAREKAAGSSAPSKVAKPEKEAKPEKAGKKATGQPASAPAPASSKDTASAPRRAGRASGIEATGTIHILDKKKTFNGQRGAAWALAKEGMKVSDFYAACTKASLDGKGILSKIVKVFKTAEIV